jgi:hypothetical protein
MAKYNINGKEIELDTNKTYFDFYLEGEGHGCLVQVNLEGMLESLESNKMPVDDHLKDYMDYLQRWKTDAPRKRTLREMRKSGITVIITNNLFEEDGGEEIINNLENTGAFADYFLREVYGGDFEYFTGIEFHSGGKEFKGEPTSAAKAFEMARIGNANHDHRVTLYARQGDKTVAIPYSELKHLENADNLQAGLRKIAESKLRELK